MHFKALRNLTQPCMTAYCTQHNTYDPGISPGSADQCILGDVYLRSNLSRKHLALARLSNIVFEHHFSIRTMQGSPLMKDAYCHLSSGLSPCSFFYTPMMELTLKRTPCLACKVTQATSSSSTNFSLWTPSGSWKKKFPRNTARTVRSSAIARAWPMQFLGPLLKGFQLPLMLRRLPVGVASG